MRINLLAPINTMGYGVAGMNIAYELSQMTSVYLHIIGMMDRQEIPREKFERFEQLKLEAMFYDTMAPSVKVWHENMQAEHVGRGPRFAFPFFELDPLHPGVKHHLNSLEGLIVASDWARNVAIASGITKPICVAPLGVDRAIFHEKVKADRQQPDHTIFVNIGKWEHRKGHDFLLRCFCKAFTRKDKVLLRMLSQNPFIGRLNEEWATEYKTSPMGTNIQLLNRVSSQKEVARLIASSDVGVFPARAEGWNLDLLECLSMGKHCIATNYSAHTQYLNDENCKLIEVDQRVEARDGVFFHGDGFGKWALLDDEQEDAMIAYMRELHRTKQSGELTPNEAGIETSKRFTWHNTASQILQAIGA